jgi:hypothetical protein
MAEKLVLDWRKRQRSQQAVRVCIEQVLDTLPPVYVPEIYQRKCDLAYQHVYDAYSGKGGASTRRRNLVRVATQAPLARAALMVCSAKGEYVRVRLVAGTS